MPQRTPLPDEAEAIIADFETAWRRGQRPDLALLLDACPQTARLALLIELIHADLEFRLKAGENAQAQDYLDRFPELAANDRAVLDLVMAEQYFRERLSQQHPADVPCADPGEATVLSTEKPSTLLRVLAQRAEPAAIPDQIDRYRVERLLGSGGFGQVYLARDDQLQRLVAIKVPHPHIVARSNDVELYLAEARAVANLDHPNIVTVYDAGVDHQFPCFIVTKYIDGTDLATKLKDSRLALTEAVELTATVAEALHHAHKCGIVHRDVKPGNILIDRSGKPYLADFGLALRDQDLDRGPRYAGTPAYMSPEQARGEGHRVDGRSDIYSLGVVLYELLVGRRPFRSDSTAELLGQIVNREPCPPRQIDDSVPKELDRICLKALSKRASERYSAAWDLAEDLRHFLADRSANHPTPTAVTPPAWSSTSPGQPLPSPASDPHPIKIVPKGLRSFDAHDADFFLELLPGPRDRDGLPDSIRLWKTCIEETDAEKTFSVGLICGPSGCGKSSLVKAGLLPRLSDAVIAIYVEATGEETEARLLSRLRKRCPALPATLGLKETLTLLRRGQGTPSGKKVLIVLDQFEQWLHAKKEEPNAELVQALRQCDGGRVQCIVMVRDDFWMAVIRFMRDVEVRLIEGQNSAVVDLFDRDHARGVLSAFGRAFGRLPENPGALDKQQKEFLEFSVSGLAREGKIIPVRLALFAEMMKGKSWTPASLKAVGGTEGVGVTFLEETFSAATAPPAHKYHQKAARAVLKLLLPETGGDIKGQMRYSAELLDASGYAARPSDFDDLVHILDHELRLITPTDPEGVEGAGRRVEGEDKNDSAKLLAAGVGHGAGGTLSPSTIHPPPSTRYYQLTHDYLVHASREWLTRKQKETARGRAELLLADRAAVWTARPEKRQLPSLLQWLQILWLTAQKSWTAPQRKMMAKTRRHHVVRVLLVSLFLATTALAGLAVRNGIEEQQKSNRAQAEQQRKATHAAGLVQAVLRARTAQTPAIIEEMSEYRQWTDPLLREEYAKASDSSRQKLHASLALLPVDSTQTTYLKGRLLDAEAGDVAVLRDALFPYREQLVAAFWTVVDSPERGRESQRIRAAAALARYDPESDRWAKSSARVVHDLVHENTVFLLYWSEAFRPVKERFLTPLGDIYRDLRQEVSAERALATDLLSDYAADNPSVLAGLLMDADEKQFAVIFPKFRDLGESAFHFLTEAIDATLPGDVPSSDPRREALAKRKVNAAAALLRLKHTDKVWPLFEYGRDMRVRSRLIHRLSPLGVDAGVVIERLAHEPDVAIRRVLLLSLGEFDEKELPAGACTTHLPRLQAIYRDDPDPGMHAAVEWLLRRWKEDAWLKRTNDKWAGDREQRKQRMAEIDRMLEIEKENAPRQWYVNSQGQTLVVLPGPVEFTMGSPATEAEWRSDETQHTRRIGRTVALSATHVTKEQFLYYDPSFTHNHMAKYPEPTCPIGGVLWHEAAQYCNWLSKVEGLPEEHWCYEIKGDVVKLKAAYLRLSGYRLPTEAEMEYAARAETRTSRHFGESDDLLIKYARYERSETTWPAGSLKPNDWGLFDTLGNMYTWCQEKYRDYPDGDKTVDDEEDELVVRLTERRVLRGAGYLQVEHMARSSFRYSAEPHNRYAHYGFRVARTVIPQEDLLRFDSKSAAEIRRKTRETHEKVLELRPDDATASLALANLLLSETARWQILDPVRLKSAGGAILARQPDGSILAGGVNSPGDAYHVGGRPPPSGIRAIRLEAIPDSSLPHTGPGRSSNSSFALTEFTMRSSLSGNRPIAMDRAAASSVAITTRGTGDRIPASSVAHNAYANPVRNAIDGRRLTGWNLVPQAGAAFGVGMPHTAVFTLPTPIAGAVEGTDLTITLNFGVIAPHSGAFGRFRLSVSDADRAMHAEEIRMSSADPQVKLAAARFLAGQREAALELLRRMEGKPRAPDPINLLLIAWVREAIDPGEHALSARQQYVAWLKKKSDSLPLLMPFIATEVLLRAASDQPRDATIELWLARTFDYLGADAEAIAHYGRVMATQPNSRENLLERGRFFLRLSKWKEAAVDFQRAIILKPDDHWVWFTTAPLILWAGDVDGYRRHCEAMVTLFGKSNDIAILERTAMACSLASATPETAKRLVEISLRPVQARSGHACWYLSAHALANYRAGNLDAAIDNARRAIDPGLPQRSSYVDALGRLIQALAHNRLGHRDEARRLLAETNEIIARDLPDIDHTHPDGSFHALLCCLLLQQEATAAIAPNTQPRAPAPRESPDFGR